MLRQRSKKTWALCCASTCQPEKKSRSKVTRTAEHSQFSHTEVMTTVLKARGLKRKKSSKQKKKKLYLGRFPKHQKTEKYIEPFVFTEQLQHDASPLTCCKNPAVTETAPSSVPQCRLQTLPFKLRRQGVKVKSDIVHVGKNVLIHQILDFLKKMDLNLNVLRCYSSTSWINISFVFLLVWLLLPPCCLLSSRSADLWLVCAII